jgi:hypothetical protein
LVESGSTAIDANNDGVIDGVQPTFGANGLSSSVETSNNSTLNMQYETRRMGLKTISKLTVIMIFVMMLLRQGSWIQIMMAY